MFGSTHACEQLFSVTNLNQIKHCSQFKDSRLNSKLPIPTVPPQGLTHLGVEGKTPAFWLQLKGAKRIMKDKILIIKYFYFSICIFSILNLKI